MDVRLQGNSQLHYGVNGGATRNSSPGGDTLKFLSREEQECLQFFEETIESLDDGLDEQQQRLGQRRHLERNSQPYDSVDGHPNLAPNIIDLVHSEPDLVHTAEPVYSPSHQDFYHMPNTPESNFEARPRHDMFPSEYNPPLRSPSFGTTDSHSSYHPPGSVPTPVLIAQQLAENQGDGTSNLHPSSLLRRLSMESEKAPRDRSNISAKHGPPPSPKPAHYPPNIHVVHGGKEPQIPGANVNIHERQEQMLAHLAGTSHPLLQDIEDNTRNSPSRSISFKDPEPDKSRMEALSKLGLTRGRATSLQMIPDNNSQDPHRGPDPRISSPDFSLTPTAKISTDLPQPNMPVPPPVCFNDHKNTETWPSHSFRSNDERSSQLDPSSPTMSSPPADITSPAFNTFGGKSIVVHPSLSQKNDAPTSPTTPEPQNLPLAPSNPIEPNPYGGKSKVMTSANPPVERTNLPDILSSHIDTGETIPAKPEPPAVEANRFGGKSRTFDPVSGLYRTSEGRPRSVKPPPPTPAPRPPRQSYHGILPQKPPARASSPEYRRRPSSMFRPQGITVQFCGRGAMNESRREALRRLGLLKDS
ncbi:proline and serine-rich protein 2 [Poecilia formosa]|uniref:proline and serine-rich protein 2 n=1 Tax=Poecilia formosa TaxID=48698 RepID=UPI000443EF90|nr:PREDICTED: proline and serine-rich protein 2 [Poecilia formosa]